MEILFVLIPLSLILVSVAVYLFNWAVKSGQFDDLEGPAHRILYDDDADMIPVKPKPETNQKHASKVDKTIKH
ncbi:MAG: cbb3-type cytochrome oxidase assembly protein CcoS [Hahellaceae bacterium]|nr:cbb3-type cytochrome oxidase assembly protein CcoS [Hahellaceae bacterium]